ncbi:MAG TPA: Cof-type HAD-IIB family hydrolase [Termitinemataceae bacterium]|nr:Cof-type HAD-IIB family hydrolase [Termitinemataceae bacterium]HPP99822.1 Cof-type HAD-IIB family hydrolase [Termitinemataceae bacterium]
MNLFQLSFQFQNIRALALDLDGTILHTDASLGTYTKETLRLCIEQGITLIFCTGRSPEGAEAYRAAIGASGPMVFYNGACVVDVPAGEVLQTTLLEKEVVLACLSLVRKEDLHFQVYTPDNRLYYERDRPEAGAYEKRTGVHGTVVDIERLFTAPPRGTPHGSCYPGVIKAMVIASPEQLSLVERFLDERYGPAVYHTRSHDTYLEILSPAVSKGKALARALELRGLTKEQTLAFGDGENDLPLLDVAACLVAPENADPRLKERACQVVPSCDEEGPARFIRRYVLKTET